MPTENLPADAILYLLGDLPVVVAPGKDPVALYNKTVSHGAEEAIELIERALTDAEKSQLFKLPQLSRDAFAKLTPPPWVEAQATQKELPRWVAWLRTKAANFKAKHTAKPQEAAKPEAKPAEPKPQHTEGEEDISGASDKDKHEASWKPKLSFRAVIAVAILGLFSVPFILQIPGCAKKKTGKATAVAAKSASKKADVEDDFMGGKPASKSAPQKPQPPTRPTPRQRGLSMAENRPVRKRVLVSFGRRTREPYRSLFARNSLISPHSPRRRTPATYSLICAPEASLSSEPKLTCRCSLPKRFYQKSPCQTPFPQASKRPRPGGSPIAIAGPRHGRLSLFVILAAP